MNELTKEILEVHIALDSVLNYSSDEELRNQFMESSGSANQDYVKSVWAQIKHLQLSAIEIRTGEVLQADELSERLKAKYPGIDSDVIDKMAIAVIFYFDSGPLPMDVKPSHEDEDKESW